MTIEQQLREQFDRAADDLGSADLDVVLDQGRRHRRRRVGAIAVGSVAAAAAVALAVTPLVHDRVAATPVQPAGNTQSRTPSQHPSTSTSRHISASPVGRRLQAAVAAAAPELPTPSKVYPSDWNHDTAIPESQAANATEWQLSYQLPRGETVLVYTSRKLPGYPASTTCPSAPPAGLPNDNLPCRTRQVNAGRLQDSTQQLMNPTTKKPMNTQFLSFLVRSDGSVVNVIETVPNGDAKAAEGQRSLTDAQLDRIATTDGLDVPAPKVTPAPPTAP